METRRSRMTGRSACVTFPSRGRDVSSETVRRKDVLNGRSRCAPRENTCGRRPLTCLEMSKRPCVRHEMAPFFTRPDKGVNTRAVDNVCKTLSFLNKPSLQGVPFAFLSQSLGFKVYY
ncbi:hypothetical protein SRHO_G00305190 [Serrasalmus rhombeus]